jgi:hypothetical protein
VTVTVLPIQKDITLVAPLLFITTGGYF